VSRGAEVIAEGVKFCKGSLTGKRGLAVILALRPALARATHTLDEEKIFCSEKGPYSGSLGWRPHEHEAFGDTGSPQIHHLDAADVDAELRAIFLSAWHRFSEESLADRLVPRSYVTTTHQRRMTRIVTRCSRVH
jgi:hypothetical protein